jgi:DNA-binding NtrC family response regulator
VSAITQGNRCDQGLIGDSPVMSHIRHRIRASARSRAAVFITGPTGTGKELCAEAIHRMSPRASGPLIAINCGAIPKDLMESEIFGHRRGSFTGAFADSDGAAKQADGGTLFLDEICELELPLQTKLLRFLDTGAVQKVGSANPEHLDIRVICATNRNPLAEVRAGRFRDDLYYRLNVLPIHMPPLNERREDVPALARHFLALFSRQEGKSFAKLSPAAERWLSEYDWPGNVRELQNILRRAVVLNDADTLEAEMLTLSLALDEFAGNEEPLLEIDVSGLRKIHSVMVSKQPYAGRKLRQIEREAIQGAIAACGESVPLAARALGISPSTIYRKREAWK